jgi:eukaryotic-like serine/threonine-protein kinase
VSNETTVASGAPLPPQPVGNHPSRIGPYRILRVLGQGGMGLVYEAEQLEPLRRMVALKVIRRGMDSREVLVRFESERQALAVMDHPNIAKALDAGTTEDGLPYFVMELVAGVPITEYCDVHELDVRQRLELFTAVCKGVQHAHQKGVIHRDLKPSNILVRVTDGEPVPTIIDFGIAKAVEQRLTDKEFTTALGVMVGTPAYMSPEQAEASGLDIDTRADIYSLGIVLYELVTGVLPFDVRGLLPGAFIARYVLGDADTPTPSHRVAALGADLAAPVAQHRHTTPVGLRRMLRGDLDWIVLKAIDRDRGRRYETANGLASDIERHLENKPVTARPPTLGYTAAKFVRRHRVAVSVAAAAVVALAVMVAGIVRERNRAELASAKALAISAFLQDMLKSADPWQGGARQTTVAEALQAGVKRLNEGAIRDPLVAASIKRTIGSVYLGLGRIGEADTLVRAALAERIARAGPASEDAAESYEDLGNLYRDQGKFDSAAATLERALGIRRRLHGSDDTLVVASLLDLSDVASQQGDLGRADSLAREGLRVLRGVYGERHPALADAMGRIVSAALGAGNLPRADSTARAAIAMLRGLGLSRSPAAAPILNDLAISRAYQGDRAESMALMREVVAMDSANFGPAHPDLAAHLENFAMIYGYAGFQDSNAALLKQVLAMRRALLADDNPAIGRTLYNLANADYSRADYAAAEPLFEEALVRMRRAYGAEHPDVVWTTAAMGRNEYYLGRRADAERHMRWALDVKDPNARLAGRDLTLIGPAMVSLLMDQRRWAEAEPVALRVLAIRDSLADTLAGKAAAQLATLYDGWGKPERAAEYRRRAAASAAQP